MLALLALSLLGDRATIAVALENLKNSRQVVNALDTLESIRDSALIRPLFPIWEPGGNIPPEMSLTQVLSALGDEKDEWLHTCAHFAKEETMETLPTLSTMERVLLLRRVPLLAELTPTDLQRIAAIASEQGFEDGETVCEQGEPGDEMYIIVSGEVRIVVHNEAQEENEVARRGAGDVVGEMAIISGEPRSATVTAVGEVRVVLPGPAAFRKPVARAPGSQPGGDARAVHPVDKVNVKRQKWGRVPFLRVHPFTEIRL